MQKIGWEESGVHILKIYSEKDAGALLQPFKFLQSEV